MRGHICKRGDPGSWFYKLDQGRQPAQRCEACHKLHWTEGRRLKACETCGGELADTSERRTRMVGGFRTRKEAEQALNNALHNLQGGNYVGPARITLGQYLLDEWLPAQAARVANRNLKETTYISYEMLVTQHLIPRLGTVKLTDLCWEAIESHYAFLSKEGRSDGSGGLSAASVHRVHAVLHRAMRDAVRSRRLAANPADGIELPKEERKTKRVWNAQQLRAFLDSVQDDGLYALWVVYATTGCRRGEALGLKWNDVDLTKRTVTIGRALVPIGYRVHVSTPKTEAGFRVIALDPATTEVLKTHRKRQAEKRLQWGAAWNDGDWVFTTDGGEYLHPNVVYRAFKDAAAAVNLADGTRLPDIPLHGLRHTYATIALSKEGGQPVPVVSERLGHRNASVTLGIYAHGGADQDRAAASAVADIILPTSGH